MATNRRIITFRRRCRLHLYQVPFDTQVGLDITEPSQLLSPQHNFYNMFVAVPVADLWSAVVLELEFAVWAQERRAIRS